VNRFPLLFLALLSLPTSLRAQEPAHAHGGEAHRLGTVTFPNSGTAAAQEPFLRGIALLHSFEYADAAEAFREAQQADPAFALAYWGEALTHTQLLWGVDDAVGAREALARLAPTTEARLARAGNSREREYGAAVEAFYADADVAVRARGFADSLHALAAREPDDLEAAAFASIAIQMALAEGVYPPEERTAMREEAIALADRVFGANPDHPGAAHYLIHAYDDPVLAPEGLDAARAYASIAPDAVHALHMPSHIFVQIGLWDDAAASNEKAWAASRAWVSRREAPGTEHDFHSLQWLQYAYLQQGRYRMAAALVDSARVALTGTDLSAGQYPDAIHVVGRLEFALAAETGRWEDWRPAEMSAVEAEADPATASRARFFERMAAYQRAAGSAMRGDPNSEVAVRAYREGAEPGSGAGFLTDQLDALAAGARGDTAAMLAGLAEAATAEERMPPVGPPSFLPSHELLGQALLEAGGAGEAVAAFERALERRPNRSPALLGLARARAAAGDRTGAAEAYRELLGNWERADPDLAPLAEARAAVGQTP
jgi:tetratricopeptide (TPR) repeat protein